MDDRELLELAAKAAGEVQGGWIGNAAYLDGVLSRWNPLTDDGDALRLAATVGIGTVQIRYADEPRFGCRAQQIDTAATERSDDPCTATRRAIVRVAAELAKENNDAAR